MSKQLLIAVIVVSVIAGIAIGYYRGLPDDVVEFDATAFVSD